MVEQDDAKKMGYAEYNVFKKLRAEFRKRGKKSDEIFRKLKALLKNGWEGKKTLDKLEKGSGGSDKPQEGEKKEPQKDSDKSKQGEKEKKAKKDDKKKKAAKKKWAFQPKMGEELRHLRSHNWLLAKHCSVPPAATAVGLPGNCIIQKQNE